MKATTRLAALSFALLGALAYAEQGERPPLEASKSEWTQVPNSKFIDHVQCKGLPNCNPSGVLDAWSSAVLDTTRNCLVFFGGGHADSWYNGVDRFCLETGRWENLLPFTAVPEPDTCSNTDSNGNPVSRHTYGTLTYIPKGSRPSDYMLMHGGSRACRSGSFGEDTWLFNFTTNAWEFVGDSMRNSPGKAWANYCAYDGPADKVYCAIEANGWLGFRSFDPTSRTWATILPFFTSGPGSLDDGSNPVIIHSAGHPLDGHFVMLSSAHPGKIVTVDLRSPSFRFRDLSGSVAITKGAEGVGLDWNGTTLLAWSGVESGIDAKAVWEIDPSLHVVEKTFPSGPAVHDARWVLGKWRFSAASNAYVAVHDVNQNVWKLSYAPSSPSARTDPTTSVPESTAVTESTSFAERCAQPGVVLCDPLDTEGPWGVGGKLMKNPDGTTGIPTQSWWQKWRGVGNNSIHPLPGQAPPRLDTEVKASGAGSLRFDLPTHSDAPAGGVLATNFSDDLSVQFGPGDTFYVQFRWRADCAFLYFDCDASSPTFRKARRYYRSDAGGKTNAKLAIIGTGDPAPGESANSCTSLEIVETLGYDHLLMGYHSCDWYQGFYEDVKGNTELQPGGVHECLYNWKGPAEWGNTGPDCWKPEPDEWITVQIGLSLGPWQTERTGERKSRVRIWGAHEGKRQELVVDHKFFLHAPEKPTDRFGKIWLLPYMTNKDPREDHPPARVWYDELIVSREFIADPN